MCRARQGTGSPSPGEKQDPVPVGAMPGCRGSRRAENRVVRRPQIWTDKGAEEKDSKEPESGESRSPDPEPRPGDTHPKQAYPLIEVLQDI